jgi:hypothetical protein
MLDVKKTAVSSAMRILLKVAEVKPVEPMGKMNNTVRMLNTTALQNNADIVNANVMYDTALAQIKRTKPDLFNFCTSDQVDLQVAVVAAKQEGKVMKNGLSTIMKSYRIDASLLDLSDIVTDNKLETGTIVNAKVTLKLNPVEREAIMIASAQKEETNMAQEIISRINVFKPKAAKDLVSKIKKGEVTKEILDGLRYYVDSTRPDLYLKVEQKITVSFNYTNISASQEDFTKTVAHEFGHCRYPFQHLFWALKWGLIVERKSSFKYKLSNELGLNGIGMCSEGTGHEMYNPENKEVCDCEKGLPK